jgi:hypothetical protein
MNILGKLHLATSQEVRSAAHFMAGADCVHWILHWLVARILLSRIVLPRMKIIGRRAASRSAHPCYMFRHRWMKIIDQLQGIVLCGTFNCQCRLCALDTA